MKRRRPCSHTRLIKTKKGKKRVKVNSHIPRRIKRKRSPERSPTLQDELSPLSEMKKKKKRGLFSAPSGRTFESLLSDAKKQIHANVDYELRSLQEEEESNQAMQDALDDLYGAKLKKSKVTQTELNRAKKELEEKKAEIFQREKAISVDLNKTKRQAQKKVKEARRILAQLMRKKKDQTRVGFVEDFRDSSGKDIRQKLAKIEEMGIKVGDLSLINTARDMESELEEYIKEPRRNVTLARLEQKESDGKLTKYEKVGLEALRMPEVKSATILSTPALDPKVQAALDKQNLEKYNNYLKALDKREKEAIDLRKAEKKIKNMQRDIGTQILAKEEKKYAAEIVVPGRKIKGLDNYRRDVMNRKIDLENKIGVAQLFGAKI